MYFDFVNKVEEFERWLSSYLWTLHNRRDEQTTNTWIKNRQKFI
jgi:hypothetical protein